MLPKAQRLSPRERVGNSLTIRGDFLFLKAKKTSEGVCRIGFVISKKIDKRAVRRNRLRRVLAEAFSKSSLTESGGYDILCIVSKPVSPEDEKKFVAEFENLLIKILP